MNASSTPSSYHATRRAPCAKRPPRAARAACAAFLAAALTAAVAPDARAQDEGATFMLRVTESETGRPLHGARVEVLRRGLRGFTGPDGWVRITGVPTEAHVVEVRHLGYAAERLTLDFTRVISVKGNVALRPDALTLDAVEVVAERTSAYLQSMGFYHRRRASRGSFLTRSEILERVANDAPVSQVLRRVPGLSLRNARSGFSLASRRDTPYSSSCLTRVFLNGAVVGGNGMDNLDSLIAVRDLEALEWYAGPSTTPPQFNLAGSTEAEGSACGTLVLWTRVGR
jgi:hypothetical protein